MRRTTLASLAATAILLSGCGDGGDPSADPSSTPGDGSTSGAADPSPSEPAVAPATGFLIDLDRIRMHAPEGWRRNDPLSTFLLQADDPDTASSVSLGDLSAVGDPTLQESAEVAIAHRRGAEVLEPVEIAGVAWYHVGGRDGRSGRFEQFGTVHNGSQATIDFSLDDEIPADEQQEIIDSVLASVEWK